MQDIGRANGPLDPTSLSHFPSEIGFRHSTAITGNLGESLQYVHDEPDEEPLQDDGNDTDETVNANAELKDTDMMVDTVRIL